MQSPSPTEQTTTTHFELSEENKHFSYMYSLVDSMKTLLIDYWKTLITKKERKHKIENN